MSLRFAHTNELQNFIYIILADNQQNTLQEGIMKICKKGKKERCYVNIFFLKFS